MSPSFLGKTREKQEKGLTRNPDRDEVESTKSPPALRLAAVRREALEWFQRRFEVIEA